MPGTETSPVYGLSIWAGPQATPWEVENTVQRAFEALIRASVSDRDLAAAPGSSADGEAFLVAGTPAGGDPWEGKGGQMAVAVGVDASNGWIFLPVAQAGYSLLVIDEGLRIRHDGSSWNVDTSGGAIPQTITLALSDLTSDLTAGAGKAYWDAPYPITISSVSASVLTAPTGSGITVDINEEGVSILSTPITIDDAEVRSADSATPPVVSDSAVAGRLTFDIDAVGSTTAGQGLLVTVEYTET